ncbi:hypothetical protein BH23PAT1_BH23PAT1_0410 [soil metagenome]
MARFGTVHIYEEGPDKTVMDFTPIARKMLGPKQCYGHAFRLVASHLLHSQRASAERPGWERLIVSQSSADVRDRAWFLDDQKEVIAKAAASLALASAKVEAKAGRGDDDPEIQHIDSELVRLTVLRGVIGIKKDVVAADDTEPVGKLCVAALRPFIDAVSTHDEGVRLDFLYLPRQDSEA